MEQHPVPQNVTTFQFRLVGDMTIKQFGYLASGIIGGYICYKLPLPFFFTWPLAITSGLLGFGLAFVPVEERPMDVWIASFFKNVYSPTQWIWQKGKGVQPHVASPPIKQAGAPPIQQTPSTHHVSMITRLTNIMFSFLVSTAPPSKAASVLPKTTPPPIPLYVPQKTQPAPTHQPSARAASGAILSAHQTMSLLDWFKSIFRGKSKPVTRSLSPEFSFADALAARPTPSVVGKHIESSKESQMPVAPPPLSTPQLVVTSTPPSAPFTTHPTGHERMVELQGQLSEALGQRERLEKELAAVRLQMDSRAKSALRSPMRQASTMPFPAPTSTTSVRVIAPDTAAKAGLPHLTTFPNVVTGIVKDHYGNLLAGILITVRDKDDTPLRALKTNKLGQFAASTPLPNNTYIVEIEDPKGGLIFDKVQIPLTGAVAPPIEVTAKSQKQVERDKLAREIFGNQPM